MCYKWFTRLRACHSVPHSLHHQTHYTGLQHINLADVTGSVVMSTSISHALSEGTAGSQATPTPCTGGSGLWKKSQLEKYKGRPSTCRGYNGQVNVHMSDHVSDHVGICMLSTALTTVTVSLLPCID